MKHRYDQVRIIASPEGTTILDAERKALTNVFAVNIALRAAKPPVIQMNMIAGNFDVVGVPTFMAADPAGGPPKPVKAIEFWDGTGIAFPEAPPSAVVMQPPPGGASSADPAGAKPITPSAALEVRRQLVDLKPGEQHATLPADDLPLPPDGQRWETDAELRDRAVAIAQAARDEPPASVNAQDAPKLDS